MFWHCVLQISLHLSAEMADLRHVDYLSMFFRCLFGQYCDGNINDFVMLLNFPARKVRILDLLRFERVSSLFSASFFLKAAPFAHCPSAARFPYYPPKAAPFAHCPFAARFPYCPPTARFATTSFLLWSLRTSHQAITPSSLLLKIPGPAECAKRLNKDAIATQHSSSI